MSHIQAPINQSVKLDGKGVRQLFDNVVALVEGTATRSLQPVETLLVNLTSLKASFDACIRLHDEYASDALPFRMIFDPTSESIFYIDEGKKTLALKLRRADPNVPISMNQIGYFGAFIPTTDPSKQLDAKSAEIELRMSAELESFYYSASKAWDRFEQDVCGKSKSRFIGVKMVRNKLFEHSVKGELNSFGFTDSVGPVVKPMRSGATRAEVPHDSGLIPNAIELIEHIKDHFARIDQYS